MIDHGSQSLDQDARASMLEACRADALPVILDQYTAEFPHLSGFCRRYFSRLNRYFRIFGKPQAQHAINKRFTENIAFSNVA